MRTIEGRVYPLREAALDDIPDPIEIVETARNIFPEHSKMYAFMGVPSILETKADYLRQLHGKGKGLNRPIVGIESTDDMTSGFLNKPETDEDKIEAIEKLQGLGCKVKITVLVGVVGERFYYKDDWRSSRDGLQKTAEDLHHVMRGDRAGALARGRIDKVLVSRYVPVPGTRLAKMPETGEIIEPFTEEELDAEIEWLIEELGRRDIIAEPDYQMAIQKV